MKILILGAGAIGGYVGGRLHQSGADVTFLVRPARQQALRDGLVIKSTKGDITQTVKTVLEASEGGPYDIVLLTPKAYDLDSAVEAIAPAVGASTTVVPLLNGMRHLDVLEARFGKDKVVGGLARVGVALSAEGAILHTSPFAAISFGERDGREPRASLKELDAAVKKSGVDGGLHANIVQDLWDKWVMLCSLAATNCLMRGSSGDILEADEGRAIVLETVDECRKVAGAAGHDPGEKGMQTIRGFLTVKGSRFTASMLHDLEKGAMVEADHIVGDMIARAKKAGISTPNLRISSAHLQVYLARRSRAG
ncbi:MAG: ketopantoate reductase family protein [Reyranella sp.]|uniref:ketopantoate reductase family protein n=1 Tax=Reyranella sp. TaxID=1929291 RepID=UPI001AC36E96|nr:ketopantoate reductase family protein [Reyranella sp.]MBN9091607.1 ketopantoate reductase family protein [Reyranella sp.]